MVELKKTLFFWTPFCLLVFGSASYLVSDSSYVSDFERLEAPTFAITTQAKDAEQAKGRFNFFR
jgi:hypothetical protein